MMSICDKNPAQMKDSKDASGTILVFLSCFSEILDLYDLLSISALQGKLEVHMLHRNTLVADHKKMLLPPVDGRRKVILTTSIGETSIPFGDIVYVIDCGRLRDSEDEVVVSNNRTTSWITKVSSFSLHKIIFTRHFKSIRR